MHRKFIILFLLINASIGFTQQSTPLPAAEERDSLKGLNPIVTDRPDITESSSTVPAKTLQIETGVIFEKTAEPEFEYENWFLGTTLLRYGVWDNFEIRVGSYYQLSNARLPETGQDSTQQGFGPLVLGFKVYIVEEKGLRPEISIIADMTLRHVGSPDLRPVFSYPTAKISASHTLGRHFSLGYNAGFAYNGSNADGFFLYSAALSYSITSRLGLYGEVYGTFDHGNLPNHRIDGGFTYLLANNFQLDISAGTGLDNNIDKHFLSCGFSWRIPR